MSENKDTPDTPPEIVARQSRNTALTPQTAELIGAKAYQRDDGKMSDEAAREHTRSAAAKDARTRAEAWAGPTPMRGVPESVMDALRGNEAKGILPKVWEDAPEMDSTLGYRTPKFVNWLWAQHPHDAALLYAYKDIWPTALPQNWNPPKRAAFPALNGAGLPALPSKAAAERLFNDQEVNEKIVEGSKAPAVAPRVFTQEEVAAILRGEPVEGFIPAVATVPAKPRAKRIYVRRAHPKPISPVTS